MKDLKVSDESSGRFSLKDTLYLSSSVNFLLLDRYSVSSEGLWNVGLLWLDRLFDSFVCLMLALSDWASVVGLLFVLATVWVCWVGCCI